MRAVLGLWAASVFIVTGTASRAQGQAPIPPRPPSTQTAAPAQTPAADEQMPPLPSMEGQQGEVVSRTAVSPPLKKKHEKEAAELAAKEAAAKREVAFKEAVARKEAADKKEAEVKKVSANQPPAPKPSSAPPAKMPPSVKHTAKGAAGKPGAGKLKAGKKPISGSKSSKGKAGHAGRKR